MGSMLPTILSTAISLVGQASAPRPSAPDTSAQLATIQKRSELEDRERRSRYRNLLASERTRLAGSGISSNSGLASSILMGLAKRQAQEKTEAREMDALDIRKLTQPNSLLRRDALNQTVHKTGFDLLQKAAKKLT